MPGNHTDIGAGPQVCVTNTDAVAVANETEATPFRSEMKIYNRLGDTVVLIDGGPHFELTSAYVFPKSALMPIPVEWLQPALLSNNHVH